MMVTSRHRKDVRVALIIPPYEHHPMKGLDLFRESPLTCFATMASALSSAGADARILDWRLLTKKDCLSQVADVAREHDVFGITCFSNSYNFLKELVPALRNQAPQALVVLGGSLLTACPEPLIKGTGAQLGVIGEGEETFQDIIRTVIKARTGDLYAVPGTVHTERGDLVSAGQRRERFPLHQSPMIDLSYWPVVRRTGQCRVLYYEASRGCPYSCAMCYRPLPGLSQKTPKQIETEITTLKEKYGTEFVFFVDCTFNTSATRLTSVCDAMKTTGVLWGCMLRPNGLTDSLARRMSASGCRFVRFGVESFDDDTLTALGKGITEIEIESSVAAACDANMIVSCWFLVGLESETEQSISKTLAFVSKYPIVPRPNYLIPLPGTPLGDQTLSSGQFGSVQEQLEYLSEQGDGHHFFTLSKLPEEHTRSYFDELIKVQDARSSMLSSLFTQSREEAEDAV